MAHRIAAETRAMETHTKDASYIVHDFTRFSTKAPRPLRTGRKEKVTAENCHAASLDRLRQDMTHDDGLGSYGSYKCPIF